MPGGRPLKVRHAGGRPAIYLTDEGRKAARKAAQDRWYFNPSVHKRVKKKMRARYNESLAVQERQDGSEKPKGPSMLPDTHNTQTEIPARKAARNLQQRFRLYIDPSDHVFLRRTLERVQAEYTLGEAAPVLDRIQEDLSAMEREAGEYLNEVLNTLGAWANEYLEIEAIRDGIKWLLRTIIDLQCSAMEGTLEELVRLRKFAFLQ